MGCDIHPHIEIQNEDGTWHYFGTIELGRSYTLFSSLSPGVRGDEANLKVPYRGELPDGVTQQTRTNYQYIAKTNPDPDNPNHIELKQAQLWHNPAVEENDVIPGPDWHSINWCTAQEYLHAVQQLKQEAGEGWGYYIQLGKFLADLPNARLIYWFDN